MLKKAAKAILKNLGLLNKAKAAKFRIVSGALAREEFSVNTETLKGGNALEHTLRTKIHGLEKLIVIDNKAILTNSRPIIDILSGTDTLLVMGYQKDSGIVVDCLSIINCFISACQDKAISCVEVRRAVGDFIEKHNLNTQIWDYTSIEIVEKVTQPTESVLDNYMDFAKSRVSIRKSKPDIVDPKITRKIIGLANLCPSSGNQQPCKVYYTADAEILAKLKTLCGDRQISSNHSNFMIPTVDKSAFLPTDFFQAWLNGGIFANSLINAIHAYGLGACLFQTIKGGANVQQIKQLMAIPAYEDIICMVGFGEYPENLQHIKKHRKPVDAIAIER